jgi:Tfp pilus assembly protein PilV
MKFGFPPEGRRGFSLIEVVIALGICSFAIVAILGMFSVGYRTENEASGEFNAANLASLIIAQRRADPLNTNSSGVNPALPALGTASTGSEKVGWDGQKSTAADAPYLLSYSINTSPNSLSGVGTPTNVAVVSLSLSWPAAAKATSKAVSRYEMVTEVQLQ